MAGAVIRPGMVYGPRDTRNLKLFKLIARGIALYIGDGSTLVHYVDVRDLARAFVLAMEHEERNAEIYMIAGERPASFRELTELISNALGKRPLSVRLPVKPMQWLGSACEAICRPLHIPPPIFRRRVDFYTKNRQFDASKAVSELGYRPARALEDEVADIVGWYREHGWL